MRVAAAIGVIVVASTAALTLRSLEVVTGHGGCTYGYSGCDRIWGHPAWADIAAVVVALAGVAIVVGIAAIRNPRFAKPSYY